ncbi:MAG TPA: ABC transporter ATP-binding protein [Xanthobacteraceae bacterium]|jgi:ABC-type branched-subunit amino acid transport system ATPase component
MAELPLLKVDGLASGYGKKEILHGVHVEVRRGETVCLIGPNGAGKSTVLLTILGFLRPTAGQIAINGKDVTGWEPHDIVREGVGYCPQRRNIFPDMAIGEHLDLALWGVQDAQLARSARERVFAIFPDLREKERAKARTMSGGQRQMLVFAMALMRRPELILLDEPTIGLAPKVIDSIFECLELIHRQGVSILLVEQNAAKALAHSHRAYVLDMGQNRYEGRSADLLADPKVREMYLGARK